jgi:hypothetical protein
MVTGELPISIIKLKMRMEEFGKGSKVEVRHGGGSRYYKGKITRKRTNGTFDIEYDDGDKEMAVDESLINSLDKVTMSDNTGFTLASNMIDLGDVTELCLGNWSLTGVLHINLILI